MAGIIDLHACFFQAVNWKKMPIMTNSNWTTLNIAWQNYERIMSRLCQYFWILFAILMNQRRPCQNGNIIFSSYRYNKIPHLCRDILTSSPLENERGSQRWPQGKVIMNHSINYCMSLCSSASKQIKAEIPSHILNTRRWGMLEHTYLLSKNLGDLRRRLFSSVICHFLTRILKLTNGRVATTTMTV